MTLEKSIIEFEQNQAKFIKAIREELGNPKLQDKELFLARNKVAELTIELNDKVNYIKELEESLKAAETANQIVGVQLQDTAKENLSLKQEVSELKEMMGLVKEKVNNSDSAISELLSILEEEPSVVRVLRRMYL